MSVHDDRVRALAQAAALVQVACSRCGVALDAYTRTPDTVADEATLWRCRECGGTIMRAPSVGSHADQCAACDILTVCSRHRANP